MAETMCLQRESTNLSKTLKRSNKPLMEKRRRERINSSLEQLKSLVLESMRKDTSQYSKLEKADILEMTVKHLRNVQRQQLALAAAADSTVVNKYRAGFSECAQEVTRYLGQVDGLGADTRNRLFQHLHACSQRMQMSLPVTSPVGGAQAHPHNGHHIQMPAATPYSSLPGAVTALEEQQQMEYVAAQFREMQAAAVAAAAAQASPPQQQHATSYMGSIKIVPMPSSHHGEAHPHARPQAPHHRDVSPPLSTVPSPDVASVYMRGTPSSPAASAVDYHGREAPLRVQGSTQLKIEIPTPSPRAEEVQSSTPILKCVSPPYPCNPAVAISRLPVQHAITSERVWRPW